MFRHFPGARSILNCGCALTPHHPKCLLMLTEIHVVPSLSPGRRDVPFGYCFNFHPRRPLQSNSGVPSSTRVFSVVGSIELAVVIFVPRGMNDNLSLPSPNQAMLPTPVRAVRLQYLLDGYDHSAAEFLRLGFTAGFRIQFEGNLHTVTSKILLSAYQHPHIVDLKIRKEIDAGRISRSFYDTSIFYIPCFSPRRGA